MLLDWLHSLPISVGAFVVSMIFVVPTVVGSIIIQPFVARLFRGEKDVNTVLGFLLNAFALYFGVLLALLSIAVFENRHAAEEAVDREAGHVVSLYRNLRHYPEPLRGQLLTTLKDYLDEETGPGWSAQRRGEVSTRGVQLANELHEKLSTFVPGRDPGDGLRHAEALKEFDDFIESRQRRIGSRGERIPKIMWYIVIAGAVMNVFVVWMFDVRRSTHIVVGSTLSLFIALVIYMIAILDEPFRGRDGLKPEGLILVREQIKTQ